jgi:hypothetical protein
MSVVASVQMKVRKLAVAMVAMKVGSWDKHSAAAMAKQSVHSSESTKVGQKGQWKDACKVANLASKSAVYLVDQMEYNKVVAKVAMLAQQMEKLKGSELDNKKVVGMVA